MTDMDRVEPDRNVFILTADSLNQRYFEDAAEEIASLVDGVQFSEAIATASDTNSAMPGLAAGVYSDTVSGWGIPENGPTTLAEALSNTGYRCGLWTDNYLFGEEYGYSKGFVAGNQGAPSWKKRAAGIFREGPLASLFGGVEWAYFNLFSEFKSRVFGEESFYTPAEQFHEEALSWLRTSPETGNCCWIHYMDTHHPYEPPSEYLQKQSFHTYRTRSELGHFTRQAIKNDGNGLTDEDIEDIQSAYAACCEYLADKVESFISTMLEEEHFDPSRDVLVFTADHGECLQPGRYGMMGHVPPAFWEDVIRVPLTISRPDWAPEEVTKQVSLIDFMPTVLSAVGVEPPTSIDGKPNSDPSEFAREYAYFVSEWGEEERGGMRTYRGIRSSDQQKMFGTNLSGEDTKISTSVNGWNDEINARDDFSDVDTSARQLIELLEEERGGLLDIGDRGATSHEEVRVHLRDLGYVE